MGFWSEKVQEVRGTAPAAPAPRAGAWWQQGMPQYQQQAVSQQQPVQQGYQQPQPEQYQEESELCPRCGLGYYGDFFATNMNGAGGYTGGHKRCFSCGYGNRIDQSADVLHGAGASLLKGQGQGKVQTLRVNQKVNHGSGAGIGTYSGGRHDNIAGGQLPLIA